MPPSLALVAQIGKELVCIRQLQATFPRFYSKSSFYTVCRMFTIFMSVLDKASEGKVCTCKKDMTAIGSETLAEIRKKTKWAKFFLNKN